MFPTAPGLRVHRRIAGAVGAVALVQVALGIATLLFSVPVVLGVVHQLTGALLLTLAVLALHRCRGTNLPTTMQRSLA